MSAATEVRHIPTVVAARLSQHLRGPSPPSSGSIPSSPTSVHSSSSAIFERDIEPLSMPVGHVGSPANAHRIPRAKTTETLEHSVPSVLDSAAAILTSMQNAADVAIVAPAPGPRPGSGFASPIGSFTSRSPSPALGRNSLLLSIPASSLRPPSVVAPDEPTSTAAEPPPAPSPPTFSPPHSPIAPSPTATKRLSFVSYADLLTSTPTSTVPLASLTTAASAAEPPPHIHTISCPPTASPATSLRAFPIYDAPAASRSGSPRRAAHIDDLGGEWEREGLGRGLAERLDVLYGSPPPHA